MKKIHVVLIIIFGCLGIAITFIGALAKLEHWPIASTMLIIGLLLNGCFALIGLPLVIYYFINKNNAKVNALTAASIACIGLGVACTFIGAYSKLEHWPAAGAIRLAGIIFILLAVALSIFGNLKKLKS